ncbi:MAG: hypothetical protein ACR2O8_03865 [Rhizobiaceae bacterium]
MQTIRPGDYFRLTHWTDSTRYRLVVNSRGIHLKRANKVQQWGAMLGASISHNLENNSQVAVFGLPFLISGNEDGSVCTIEPLDPDPDQD